MDNKIVRNLTRIVESYIKLAFYNSFGGIITEQVEYIKEKAEDSANTIIKKLVSTTLLLILLFWTLGIGIVTLFFYFASEWKYFNAGISVTIIFIIATLVIGMFSLRKN